MEIVGESNIIHLKTNDVVNISSDYIREGRQYESWQINEVIIDNKTAIMDVSMSAIYPPEASKEKFHLSIYLAEEMASQLMIIYGHIWAKLTEKKKEVWMLESHTKSIRAITNTEHIKVTMDIQTMRKRRNTIFGIGHYRITDNQGGLIELQQKGILS
ncbi:hypothetical protein [Sulfurovum riftiae]|uniref:Uncharacterized protein n=1 Tax=Sulfurovum riftiae TaxID=1630136 RepID=A0A151CHY0_9BACT|nr:hypothetical protein [Sulfurovum riftiae]KYJ87044.1 hypothetical protein AS592_02340 [Sulfurovum riftiae]